MKTAVLEVLGENELERSAAVNAALAANDRLKYLFSLLQMAAAHADHPDQPAPALRRERLACGVTDASFDEIVATSRREGDCYRLTNWAKMREQITQDMRVMAAPAGEKFAQRLDLLLADLPPAEDDQLRADAIAHITKAGRAKVDSLHQLVMDLHKVLNSMQAEMAEERLEGAAVYGIENTDRPLIVAFMAGLNRTAPLKFDHPGLDTTATRSGDTLVIQNDIGTTDAHVIVIHVEGLTVRLIYTDVHEQRLAFLKSMLARFKVSWDEEQVKQMPSADPQPKSPEGGQFHLVTGIFPARADAELREYLDFLGSRLVFLIDWNRARKQLRGFLRGNQRVELLQWAAEVEVGHRGFLALGGARLIDNAIEATAGSAMHFGDRLCDVLGDEAANSFLRFVLRATAEGLRDHLSPGLIQDRVRTELQAHFSSEGKRLLQLGSEHAAMIFEIASLVRDGLREIGVRGASSPHEDYAKLARRARKFEHEADQLVIAGRDCARRRPEYAPLFRLIEAADDAADELEEVAFLQELLVETRATGDALESLAGLADLLVSASQEWIKALGHAEHVSRTEGGGAQDDTSDFLTAIDALFALEHQVDDAERTCTHVAVRRARNFRQLHLYAEMAGSLEAAADALKWAGLITRDYLLGNVLGA
ncbi:MAG TPA: hypothetical protein VGN17_01285 [Bryobacteraceae bacterium]|jgi:uncharacterized protein Yka (UPF0111/DUF47 family)